MTLSETATAGLILAGISGVILILLLAGIRHRNRMEPHCSECGIIVRQPQYYVGDEVRCKHCFTGAFDVTEFLQDGKYTAPDSTPTVSRDLDIQIGLDPTDEGRQVMRVVDKSHPPVE